MKKTATENNKKYVGRKIDILIEKQINNIYFGKTRTMKNDPVSRDKNLPVFEVMFKEIQKAVASKDSSASEKLGKMTTSEMYDFFLNIRSENEEKGIE